jgi:tmRNA-binding protein
MAMSQEDKQEFQELLAPIMEELISLKHAQSETNAEIKDLKQGQIDLNQGQARLEKKMYTELNALKQGQTEMGAEIKALKQGQAEMGAEIKSLKRGQARLEKKMDDGFKFLEICINEAAVDIGKTNKRLRDHVELPIH